MDQEPYELAPELDAGELERLAALLRLDARDNRPEHVSLLCRLQQAQEHRPCSGTCDGHGSGVPCGLPCSCSCHVTDKAVTVACPECLAPAGERCQPHRGVIVHAARVAAWRAA